jgi:hypothetical protein
MGRKRWSTVKRKAKTVDLLLEKKVQWSDNIRAV